MRIILSILLLSVCYMQTEINDNFFSGTDTLYSINSPYVSHQSIIIYPDATVIIKDSVEWQFYSDSELRVLGTIQTLGDSTRNIKFTSYGSTEQWSGIFLDESINSTIQYSII